MTNLELNKAIYNKLHELAKEYFLFTSNEWDAKSYDLTEINKMEIANNCKEYTINIGSFNCTFLCNNVFLFACKV